MRTLGVLLLVTALASAQEATAPALDAVDKQAIKARNDFGALANAECAALPSVKRFQDYDKTTTAALAGKYPGYGIDWTKGALVKKGSE
jgi:hypothetical protein